MKEIALYIHIPFCDHKCIYCDFYSITNYTNESNYLKAISQEINHYGNLNSEDKKVISVFFGGGTPSFMSPEYIGTILNELMRYFHFAYDIEITLETNPGTVDKKKLIQFRNIGINRLSVGIQSFIEEELKFLTRIHDADTARRTIIEAKEAGFDNINLDLIFNLPKQSKENWLYNLDEAMKLPITHISAYSLILEAGTILNKMVLDGKVEMQDEDYDAELYEITIKYLEGKGFRQYEVSNFALPGFECVHNNAYWGSKDYIGFGTSAHSYLNSKRWWNYSSLNLYIEAMNKKGIGVAGSELISMEQQLEEYVMLSLRSSGISLSELEKRFGGEWFNKNEILLNQLVNSNYLRKDAGIVKLTASGYAICDEILKNFD
ncbi:MAG: radical SAM family heme chaperone HemW [Melioribacteraceae bacterium]|nr:radical SAM family heme chaperone HemW [Melioribacteraceae bacterium]